jgi:hypothetical protein
MTLMILSRFLITSLFLFGIFNDDSKDRTLFISPVKIPLALSGNFGELRSDHFHSGIDIKTQGVTGKEIVATSAGYVYRISISPGGFGRALYLRHPSGYSTVYAHLERFIPEIEEYITQQQYEKKSFTITVFPPQEKFVFQQGDLIAYSGNSGSSGGPHLHYEIRKSNSENPVNPLHFDFGVSDNIKPVIEKLAIYPVNRHTLINGQNKARKINVAGGNGNYHVPSGNEITISGLAGFGIKSFDRFNDSHNKCSVYSIELKIDSVTHFRYIMDEFSFNESKYINSHVDYETYLKENSFIEKTYILPNDKLSVYKDAIDRGIYDFSDGKKHLIEIILADIHGNESTLLFNVQGSIPEEKMTTPDDSNQLKMPYNRSNRFRAENINILIPAGSLYDTIAFEYSRESGSSWMYSDIHNVHNVYTPLHKAFTLSIKPSIIPAGKESKMLIVQLSNDLKRRSALNSKWTEGYLTAEPSVFGKFCITVDTVPPVISTIGFRPGSDLSGRSELRIRITDDLSGIKSYEPFVDGKWALFEYDQKNNVLIYRFDPKRIAKNSDHLLELTVTDNKDNQSTYTGNFKW